MVNWISCSESLPLEREQWDETASVNVLIAMSSGAVWLGFWSYEDEAWIDQSGDLIDQSDCTVDYWAVLPEPPR